MSNMLSGDEVSLQGYLPWLTSSDLPINHSGKLKICSSHFSEEGSSSRLIYNYECLALGVGCERGTSVNEVITLVQNTIEANKISKERINLLEKTFTDWRWTQSDQWMRSFKSLRNYYLEHKTWNFKNPTTAFRRTWVYCKPINVFEWWESIDFNFQR